MSESIAQSRKRRDHSQPKAQIVSGCQVDGASFVSFALAHGINASIAHRWLAKQTAQPIVILTVICL